MTSLRPRNSAKRVALWVFLAVSVAQLVLVACAGTDLPFDDQWDAEGWLLYPQWCDGSLRFADLFSAHNEHRIVCTKVLDLILFILNGQWDPLVQLAVGALLRAAVAAAIVGELLNDEESLTVQRVTGLAVTIVFLPHLAWNNALWGFQSQVYLAVFFSVLALRYLMDDRPAPWRKIAGVGFGLAAQLSMSAGAFVPFALAVVVAIRAIEKRKWERGYSYAIFCGAVLLATAVLLRVQVPGHAGLHVRSAGNFIAVFLEITAWPHETQASAALVLNLPVVIAVFARLARRRFSGPGEDFAVSIAVWATAAAAAITWFRGGGADFFNGVPTRYVDFIMLLPVANAWCAALLMRETVARWKQPARWAGGAWFTFLFIGWFGLSAETLHDVIIPRIRHREAPVLLTRAYQLNPDPAIFVYDPAIILPHQRPESVKRVLFDPRMQGVLPPSLQPDRPMGPLSRAVRWLLGRNARAPMEPSK